MAAFSYLVFLVVVFSCRAFPTQGYTRTVSYADEVLVKCSRLEKQEINRLVNGVGIDVWKVSPEGDVDFRVKKDQFKGMKKELPSCKVVGNVEDIVRKFEKEVFETSNNKTRADEWFEQYHRYNEIIDWWKELADKNEEVKYEESIGKSIEGRDQPAVEITAAVDEVNVIYFQCQIHAREWISGATCMYIANYLMENKESELISILLRQVKFIFVPFVNPDGYEYTWTNNRLWRKNRRPGALCDGVDLNRNYNDHWNQGGSSGNPCSETYHGASAESEVETQNTATFFRSQGNIVGAIDWHSFSQLILRPYGWTSANSPDEEQLKALGDEMSADIFAVDGKTYTSQKSIQLYLTTGTASDWFYSDNANVNNEYRAAGYTIELRDTGEYGFELPPDQIIPTGNEVVPAVLRFAEDLNQKPLQK